jgi:hypothetical protein
MYLYAVSRKERDASCNEVIKRGGMEEEVKGEG